MSNELFAALQGFFVLALGFFAWILRDFARRLEDLNNRQSSHREHHVKEPEFEGLKRRVDDLERKKRTF